jgi:hypothetical protein
MQAMQLQVCVICFALSCVGFTFVVLNSGAHWERWFSFQLANDFCAEGPCLDLPNTTPAFFFYGENSSTQQPLQRVLFTFIASLSVVPRIARYHTLSGPIQHLLAECYERQNYLSMSCSTRLSVVGQLIEWCTEGQIFGVLTSALDSFVGWLRCGATGLASTRKKGAALEQVGGRLSDRYR